MQLGMPNLFLSNSDDSKEEYVFTYWQYGSPVGGVLHGAPFLQGFGLQDGKPVLIQIHTSYNIRSQTVYYCFKGPKTTEIEEIRGKGGLVAPRLWNSLSSSLRHPRADSEADAGLFLSLNPQNCADFR